MDPLLQAKIDERVKMMIGQSIIEQIAMSARIELLTGQLEDMKAKLAAAEGAIPLRKGA